MSLFSFQGKVWAATRLSNGKPSKPVWLGNVPNLTLQLSTESTDKIESFSGNRLQYGRLQKGKTATINITLDEWLAENLALALWATKLTVVGASVTNEAFPSGLAVNDFVKLDHPFVSSVVVTDSAGTPATLTAGTHYAVESANGGLLKILNLASFTQPLRAAYTYAARESFTLFTQASPERYLILDGIDTETGLPVVAQLWRCRFDPTNELGLIHDDYGNFQLTGAVLFDTVNALNSNLGGFGRFDNKTA